MDSVLVFCILINETPKVDGTPNYAKNWDPISRVRSIERQFFRPVSNQAATQAGVAAPQPATDPLAAAMGAPQQQPAPQPNIAQQAPQPQQPGVQQPTAAQPGMPPAPGAVPPASF